MDYAEKIDYIEKLKKTYANAISEGNTHFERMSSVVEIFDANKEISIEVFHEILNAVYLAGKEDGKHAIKEAIKNL